MSQLVSTPSYEDPKNASQTVKASNVRKKRLAERRRREKIKNDPILRAQSQEKERQRYLKKKMTGKIVPVSEMSPRQKKIARKKSRESSNRHNQKKKLKKIEELELEEHIYSGFSDTEAQSVSRHDPLSQSSTRSSIDTLLPPSPNSDHFGTTLNRITRSARKRILSSTPVSSLPTHLDSDVSELNDAPSSSLLRRSPSEISTASHNAPSSSSFQRPPIESATESQSSRTKKITPKKALVSAKEKSPWKYLLRKMKYRNQKELQIKEKTIQQLKQVNERYRKQIERLKKSQRYIKPIKQKFRDNSSKIVKESQKIFIGQSKTKMKKDIEEFFEEDENSRICPGKKEYITRNKVRKQKRYLNFNLHELHQTFLKQHPEYKISYSFFCTCRPFWTVFPNVNSRDTTMCSVHENMDLAIAALKRNGVIAEKSSCDVLKSLCCDSRNVKCLSRDCNECKGKQLNYLEFDNSKESQYWIWTKSKKKYSKNGLEKVTIQDLKQKVPAYPKDIIEHFEKLLKPYMIHCANIISQNMYIKRLKSQLKTGECIIHCDFSENYNTKYASEIQSFHFGSSRQQVTLHTSVIYYLKNEKLHTQSFCTISECLRHDAVAIWEHLMPLLDFVEKEVPEVNSVYFISDSPSAQYRNRKIFYMMAKLHWFVPSISRVGWNYSEKGHGKGAPDGVGGVLKRTADQIVAHGNDIPNSEVLVTHLKNKCPGVIIEDVRESGILEKEMLIPSDLKEFRGTMKVHQVIWSHNKPNVLAMRRLSCDLGICSQESVQCPHGQHIGYFDISDSVTTNSDTKKTRASSNIQVSAKQNSPTSYIGKDQPKTKSSRITYKSLYSNHDVGTSVQDDELHINVPSDDSFWTEVPTINEDIVSSSITNTVLTILHKNNDADSSDSDLEIFPLKKC